MARNRSPKWTIEQTTVLAELQSSGHKWQEISSRISSLFPQQTTNDYQCRRRWETLVKVYKKIEGYCGNTRAHTELRDEELQSLKLATAYHRDWYSIVKEVCDRKIPRPAARMASEPSNTVSPSRNIQHRGESSTQVEIIFVPRSVERESPSHIHQYGAADIAGAMGFNQPQNSFGLFGLLAWGSVDANDMRSYQSMPETTASGISEQPLELTDDEKWADSLIVTPPEGKQVETNIVPRSVERKAPSHIPQHGAVNIAGGFDINQLEAFGPLEIPPVSTTEADAMRSYLSTKITTACFISSEQVETIYVLDREAPDHIPQHGVENIAGDLDINQTEAFGSGSEIAYLTNIDMSSNQSLYESTNSMAGGISNNILDEDWYSSDWKADIETLLASEQKSDQDTERETERETELVQTNIVPMSVDRSSASHIHQYGAVNIAGAMGNNQPQNSFGPFGLPAWELDDSNRMMFMSQNSSPSSVSTVMKTEVCVQSSEFIHETDSDSDLLSVSCSQGVGH